MRACDHTSVGILVRKGEDILLIERKLFPWGYALPAGHVDGDATFEISAARELKEETGLDISDIELLIEGRRDNQCRRPGGDWHYWKIYGGTAFGELERSEEETKSAAFYPLEKVRELARRTEAYRSGAIPEAEWEREPGLESIMLDWLRELKII